MCQAMGFVRRCVEHASHPVVLKLGWGLTHEVDGDSRATLSLTLVPPAQACGMVQFVRTWGVQPRSLAPSLLVRHLDAGAHLPSSLIAPR